MGVTTASFRHWAVVRWFCQWIHCGVPELPEMQALSERLSTVLVGMTLRRAELLGLPAKTYAPTPESLYNQTLVSVGRRAKYLVWGFEHGTPDRPAPFSGGTSRYRVPTEEDETSWSRRCALSSPRDEDGYEAPNIGVLVREYGTQRRASWWVLAAGDEGPLLGLGPEPGSAAFAEIIRTSDSRRRLTTDLRDQHFVSGIGRGWGDDILHRAKLSPFASLHSLRAEQRETLLSAVTDVLAEALELERTRDGGLSEAKLGGRFKVHGRAEEPCPTPCGDSLRRVSFESYEMTYCPTCQTGGRPLADRRLSRLLK